MSWGVASMPENYELDLELCQDVIEINLEFVPYIDETKIPKTFQFDYSPSDWVFSDGIYSIKIPHNIHKIARLINFSFYLKDELSSVYESSLADFNYDTETGDLTLYSEYTCSCRVTLFGDITL